VSNKIHECVLKATKAIGAKGINKLMQAKLGGSTSVNYRGIEQAMNAMSPILVECGITVTPAYSDLLITERDKSSGGTVRFATVKGSFTFAADDGSSVVSVCYGEAMDSGDKALTKAQSVAFRTALFQQFIVPTEGHRDPEADEDDGEDQELIAWQRVAMQGEAALRAYYADNTPTDAFWKKHQASLKADAKRADQEAK